MKRNIFCLLLSLVVCYSWAQAPGPVGGNVTLRARGGGNGQAGGPLGANNNGDAKVLQVIGLSPAQTTQVTALKQQVFADFQKFRQDHAGDRKALAEETRQRLKTYYSGLQPILTPGQAQKYNVWIKGRRYLNGANDNAALQSLQLDNDTMAKVRSLKADEARDAENELLTHLDNENLAAAGVQRAHDAYFAYLQTALTSDQWKAYQMALANPPAKVKQGNKKQL